MILALPPLEFLRDIRCEKVVECGAGTGLWLRIMREAGIDCIGYDPRPRGPDVLTGDHRNLSAHVDRMLLVVWPPDQTDLSEWFGAWGGSRLAVCGSFGRFDCPPFCVELEYRTGMGPKGDSTIKLGMLPR